MAGQSSSLSTSSQTHSSDVSLYLIRVWKRGKDKEIVYLSYTLPPGIMGDTM